MRTDTIIAIIAGAFLAIAALVLSAQSVGAADRKPADHCEKIEDRIRSFEYLVRTMQIDGYAWTLDNGDGTTFLLRMNSKAQHVTVEKFDNHTGCIMTAPNGKQSLSAQLNVGILFDLKRATLRFRHLVGAKDT